MEGKCRLAEIINCDLPAAIAHLLKDDSRSQEHKDNILNDINWLIERVQSLEFENHSVMQELNHVDAENKRYREAIKRAISKFNYDEHQQGMSELLGVLDE